MALNHPDWVGTIPQIAQVTRLSNFEVSKVIEVAWLDGKQDKRPLMARSMQPSKHTPTTVHLDNILLYNFELNERAKTLKKATREELKRQYATLRDSDWKHVIQAKKRK